MTFGTRTEARRWLAMMEADLARGRWDGDDSDGERLATYAARWIVERPGLSERSVALYEGLLRLHITPHLGAVGLRKITPAMVRSWRQMLLDGGLGESTVSKAYRLLRAVLNTAADDELIRRNPCRIKGAGVEHPAERPVLTLAEVMSLADAIEPRYRMLVLLAVFGSLRWGELVGLQRSDFDLDIGLVRIERAVSLIGSQQKIKSPKTAAGVRSVALPLWLLPDLERHFATYSEQSADGRVFVGPSGVTPMRPNFSAVWARALVKSGLTGDSRARSASHGQPPGLDDRSLHARAHGPDGARQRQCRAGLPAPDSGSGPSDRRLHGRDDRDAQDRGWRPFGARWGHGDWLAAIFEFGPGPRKPAEQVHRVERMTRIELALSAWEADVLPLNYIRGDRFVRRRGRSLAERLGTREHSPSLPAEVQRRHSRC